MTIIPLRLSASCTVGALLVFYLSPAFAASEAETVERVLRSSGFQVTERSCGMEAISRKIVNCSIVQSELRIEGNKIINRGELGISYNVEVNGTEIVNNSIYSSILTNRTLTVRTDGRGSSSDVRTTYVLKLEGGGRCSYNQTITVGGESHKQVFPVSCSYKNITQDDQVANKNKSDRSLGELSCQAGEIKKFKPNLLEFKVVVENKCGSARQVTFNTCDQSSWGGQCRDETETVEVGGKKTFTSFQRYPVRVR